jgi:hypothetical protein
MALRRVDPGDAIRHLCHPVAPAVALAAAAVATAAAALTGGAAPAIVGWLLIGLVSGYAISGSV